MKLQLTAPGASAQQIDRAMQLARSVFAAAGISPEQGARAAFQLETWDRSGFPEDKAPSDIEFDAARTLQQARHAAMTACYGDGLHPAGAALDVVQDPGESK